jgi:ADP-heptose:LPS heptosyltransferase
VQSNNDVLSILVVLPNNLGDVIMATPVLEGLKRKYKQVTIDFLCEQGFESGVLHHPFCDNLILFPRKQIKDSIQAHWQTGKNDLGHFISTLFKKEYDTIINISQHGYMSYVMQLGSKNTRILGQHFIPEGNHCVSDTWSQYLYAIPFCRPCNNLHATDVYRRIAGVKSHSGGYTVSLSVNDTQWAHAFLSHKGLDASRKIIGFQPGAAFKTKKWPAAHYIELGKMLIQDDYQILVTGADLEKQEALSIASGIGNKAFCVAGDTTFKQSMSIISLCDGCVTGDTALMHAAAAYSVKTFALFGPTNPVETGPYGDGHFVFSGYCDTMPCFKTDCSTCTCMSSIAAKDVYACITTGRCPETVSCNVYKTTLKENSDFLLLPYKDSMHAYCNQTAACLVRTIFEDHWNCAPDKIEYAKHIGEAGQWLEIVSDMCNALMRFEKTSDPKQITMFEVCKNSLSGFVNIGAFLTAVLNLRLNSIQMIDPVKAVSESLAVCWQTHKQVGRAIS